MTRMKKPQMDADSLLTVKNEKPMEMNMKKAWWEEYFGEDYLLLYSHKRDKEKSAKEVDFIEKALRLPQRSRVLDLCCGYGRHCLELRPRGRGRLRDSGGRMAGMKKPQMDADERR